jgi:mevalonate kinase
MHAQASAHGKLILSGEHSVLYAQPALVCPLALQAWADFTPGDTWRVVLTDLNQAQAFRSRELIDVFERLQKQHAAFLRGQCQIDQVCTHPLDLWAGLLGLVLTQSPKPLSPGQLRLSSEIPIGAGLGSSGALIMASLKALNQAFSFNWTPQRLFSVGLRVENWQHGQSSGLDLHAAVGDTCLLYGSGQTPQTLPALQLCEEFQVVFTGQPSSTTGACVAHVKHHHATTDWHRWGATTRALLAGLQQVNRPLIHQALRDNHRALSHLGVVPERVQAWISACEQQGISGKICGAGSVTGDSAGVVVLYNPQKRDLTPLLHVGGYRLLEAGA